MHSIPIMSFDIDADGKPVISITKIRLSYCMPLLLILTGQQQGKVELVRSNFTARGVEAVVKYQSLEEDAPQSYKVNIEPLYEDEK